MSAVASGEERDRDVQPLSGKGAASGWPTVGGDPGSRRYSPLDDIHRGNVASLEVAWRYRHGDVRSGWPVGSFAGTAFEATPILADGRLVFSTPFNRVIALEPETGRELWTFDPEVSRYALYANMMTSRGVAWWAGKGAGPCASRILATTLDARLIALDAATGRPCRGFGDGGTIDLREGVEPLVDPADYNLTSPPTVVGDVVVVGSSIADLVRRVSPPGTVRAFDVRSGKKVWQFDTLPRPGQPGVETWEAESWREGGAANVWSIITADVGRGLVFLPVSTASPDFYGGDRPGANLFSDSLVALEARTGKRVWHFQTVHHDLWDYDLAAPPILVGVRRDGEEIDAVVQATKTGLVFVLDRETGEPLFPVEERPVPASDVPGERSWPTQPFPVKPPPLVPHRFELWEEHPARAECAAKSGQLRDEGIFTPPSEGGSIVYPSTAGGVNWSGGAFDPEDRVLYVPVTNYAMTIRLQTLPPANVDDGDGLVLGAPLRALWWLRAGRGTGLRYHMIREGLIVRELPCNPPPWGELVAVDLDRGDILWRAPVGETEAGIPGTPNFGPPLVTAGGIVVHGGGLDSRFRAHDARTGEILATFDVPAGLHMGPMTFRSPRDGRQYLVVAPGGHVNLGSTLGDHVIAYRLPDESS